MFKPSTATYTLVAVLMVAVAGCSTIEPRRSGVNYPSSSTRTDGTTSSADRSTPSPAAPTREWRAVGPGHDASYERSPILTETFYANADLLLKQVDASGAMGVNRDWSSKGGRDLNAFHIEEQRFADTIIGAGINRKRQDLIDAGLRAIEWGFEKQQANGGFPGVDPYLGVSYFLAAATHSIWLLESTNNAQPYVKRILALRPAIVKANQWLLSPDNVRLRNAAFEQYSTRYFITAYAAGLSGRLLNEPTYALSAESLLQAGLGLQHSTGYFPERGGYDVSYQAEGLVYLLRYYDHVATADMRRSIEPALQNGMNWLESRVTTKGVVQTKGNTRTGFGQERDRTGAYRRVSVVAISRAFGLAQVVMGKPQYATRARAVVTARQPN